MMNKRSEYAVPNAETRHGSTSGNCQARLRNAPKPKPKTFWRKNSRDTSTTFPARKMCRLQLKKSTERAAREGKFGECAMQPLLECTTGSRYSAQRADPCTSLKEGRATCTSWRPLPRHHAESSGPGPQVPQAGGAVRDLRPRRRQLVSESVPRTCRSECDQRPEWLPRRRCRPAGARPPAGVVYGPSRVRPGRGPGHSESEEERPTRPSSARRRARAQWERGG